MPDRRGQIRLAAPAHQRGVALITAILIVAIVASVAAALSLGQQVWLRQMENINERAQANALRQAATSWAMAFLARDARESKTDHLGETWARQLPPLPAEGALITLSAEDAQGRFNLNGLVRNGQPSTPDIAIFQRLLRSEGLDVALVEPLIDWIDPDSEPRPGGAEDIDYLNLPSPYRAANQPLTSVDELRLIKGFTAEVIERLRPYVVVLPQPANINVNTALPAVLTALLGDAGAPAAQSILERRQREPFTEAGEFAKMLPAGAPAPQASYGVTSGYFLVTIGIQLGRTRYLSEALVLRPADGKRSVLVWQRRVWPTVIREEKSA
ncbi:MAG: hypothetical protein AMJ84_09690 [Acidithiobacillales bacterium SM23_46]|jgi:general secretion pathway protein K|nr:MAG: hypothetical protein AMJ84_09690 [Acidithiobacillales bacterium SM23_46]